MESHPARKRRHLQTGRSAERTSSGDTFLNPMSHPACLCYKHQESCLSERVQAAFSGGRRGQRAEGGGVGICVLPELRLHLREAGIHPSDLTRGREKGTFYFSGRSNVPGPLPRRKRLPDKNIWRRMSIRLRGAAVLGQKAHEGRAVLLPFDREPGPSNPNLFAMRRSRTCRRSSRCPPNATDQHANDPKRAVAGHGKVNDQSPRSGRRRAEGQNALRAEGVVKPWCRIKPVDPVACRIWSRESRPRSPRHGSCNRSGTRKANSAPTPAQPLSACGLPLPTS
jgi:hypothetical protein